MPSGAPVSSAADAAWVSPLAASMSVADIGQQPAQSLAVGEGCTEGLAILYVADRRFETPPKKADAHCGDHNPGQPNCVHGSAERLTGWAEELTRFKLDVVKPEAAGPGSVRAEHLIGLFSHHAGLVGADEERADPALRVQELLGYKAHVGIGVADVGSPMALLRK